MVLLTKPHRLRPSAPPLFFRSFVVGCGPRDLPAADGRPAVFAAGQLGNRLQSLIDKSCYGTI
jgi:hypothetical protein